jgi:hypothetical protein
MENNKIIFPGKVISNQDPLLIDRLRVQDKTKTYDAILKLVDAQYLNAEKTDLKPEYKWKKGVDPFLFQSLLPIGGRTPAEKEYVNIIYMNKDVNFQDQYYIQPPPAQIQHIGLEEYEDMIGQTGQGDNNKPSDDLKSPDGKTKPECEGIFPEPQDTSLLGRGSSDIIIKDRIEKNESHILIRSGKCEILESNKVPVPYDGRSFIQLSDFPSTVNAPDLYSYISLSEDEQSIRYLIEYNVLNLENQFDKFIFTLTIYELSPKSIFTTKQFNENTQLGSDAKLFKSYTFYNKSKNDIVKITNKLLSGFNKGNWDLPDFPRETITNQFPFAFRANPLTFNAFSDPTTPEFANLNLIYLRIKVRPASILVGFGVIPNSNEEGQPTKSTNQTSEISLPSAGRTTYNVQAADTLFLLSHKTSINDKGVIDFSNSIYGLDQNRIMTDIYPKTEPMVRGEQLMKLIDLIVKFMISHVHPFHGVQPVPVASDGTSVASILTELQSAPINILNQNIRIN